MKFYYTPPATLKTCFRKEMQHYLDSLAEQDLSKAWTHLERMHIIGQAYPLLHSKAHWEMLKFGVKIGSFKEISGQIPRLLAGGVKSFVGAIPLGNTGGANVSPIKTMPLPADIQKMIKNSEL